MRRPTKDMASIRGGFLKEQIETGGYTCALMDKITKRRGSHYTADCCKKNRICRADLDIICRVIKRKPEDFIIDENSESAAPKSAVPETAEEKNEIEKRLRQCEESVERMDSLFGEVFKAMSKALNAREERT